MQVESPEQFNIYVIGTWNVRSMNQSKIEIIRRKVPKQIGVEHQEDISNNCWGITQI